MPTFKEIRKTAFETLMKDIPKTFLSDLQKSHEQELEASRSLLKRNEGIDYTDDSLTCDEVTNEILLHITQFKSLFYFLVNGAYLGQLGDYASCQTFTNNGQYVLATITGDYMNDYPFSRGSYGKYIDYSTQMGICVPKQCDIDNIKISIEPLLVRYATVAGWENV